MVESAEDEELPERVPERQADRWWLWVPPTVVVGYALLSYVFVIATRHGIFDLGAHSGKSDNPFLGPFNLLVVWSSDPRADGAMAFFFLFSIVLVPALLASFGRSGCLPWIGRIAVLGIWAVADLWAWLASIPLD